MKEVDPKVNLFSKFLHVFQKETDRGASILAASMLDQKLKTILEDYLIDCKATKQLLEGFNAPIGLLVRGNIWVIPLDSFLNMNTTIVK